MSRLTVVLLPEDRAADAFSTMRELVLHALAAVTLLRRADVHFEPAAKEAAQLARAGLWKSKMGLTQLARYTATQLLLGRVVILHVDADVSWPTEPPAASHIDKLRRAIRHGTPTDNFVVMIPYAAVEAWAYRNLVDAESLARSADSAQCALTHTVWASQPSLLEEIVAIKDVSPLRDRHNLALISKRWPMTDAYADERSFRAFVDTLCACPAVRGAST